MNDHYRSRFIVKKKQPTPEPLTSDTETNILTRPDSTASYKPLPEAKVKITFYLSQSEAEKLRRSCEEEDIPISQKIRRHVKRLLTNDNV